MLFKPLPSLAQTATVQIGWLGQLNQVIPDTSKTNFHNLRTTSNRSIRTAQKGSWLHTGMIHTKLALAAKSSSQLATIPDLWPAQTHTQKHTNNHRETPHFRLIPCYIMLQYNKENIQKVWGVSWSRIWWSHVYYAVHKHRSALPSVLQFTEVVVLKLGPVTCARLHE